MTHGFARMALGIAVALTCLAARAGAQQRVRSESQFEARFEVPLSPAAGVMLGAGLNVRAGWYVRLGLAGTAGALRRGDAWIPRQRLDATIRFLLDPFAEHATGLYGGAGLGLRRDGNNGATGDLLVLVGCEARAEGRLVPAVEVTLGGGARVALVLRGRRPAGR